MAPVRSPRGVFPGLQPARGHALRLKSSAKQPHRLTAGPDAESIGTSARPMCPAASIGACARPVCPAAPPRGSTHWSYHSVRATSRCADAHSAGCCFGQVTDSQVNQLAKKLLRFQAPACAMPGCCFVTAAQETHARWDCAHVATWCQIGLVKCQVR